MAWVGRSLLAALQGRNHAACSDERAGGGRTQAQDMADGRTTSLHSRVDS